MTHRFVRQFLAVAGIFIGLLGPARHAAAEKAYGLVAPNTLILFDTAAPGTVLRTIPIVLFTGPDQIVAIDSLPTGELSQGVLFGLGASGRLYRIDQRLGHAQVYTTFSAPAGTAFGFDFNPIDGSVRIVSDTGQNLRLNRTINATASVDTPLSPAGSVVASAHTNVFLGVNATTTTLYGIDSASDTVVRQGSIDGTPDSPNGGALTTIGPLGVDATAAVGFDIGFQNRAFATLTVGGVSGLYSIDLSTGAATLVGNFGGGQIVSGLALQTPIAAMLYGVTNGDTLISFNSADPGTILSTVAVTGLQPGETIVGIDVHPDTDQLHAVGSTSRLYMINPAAGLAAQIGPAPLSPALDGAAFGVAFSVSPRSGDARTIRILSDAEQNLRVHALTGVAANDPSLSPAGSVVAAAYVKTFVTEGPTATLYGIDSASDQLVIVGGENAILATDTNNGVVTPVGSLGVDASSLASLDIEFGTAWAALSVGGISRLYTIDVATGAASLIGTIGTGAPLHALTIVPPGHIGLGSAALFFDEGSGVANVPIHRTGSTVGRMVVEVRTGNAGATPGADFTPVTQTVVFEDGVATATFSVPILEDVEDEPDEIFLVLLQGLLVKSDFPGVPNGIYVRIQDNDGPDHAPSLAIASPSSQPASTARGSFITLAGTASDDVGVTSVTWWNNRGGEGTAAGTTNWTANVPLYIGTNVLTVRATDTVGGSRTAIVTVTVNDFLYSLAEGATGTFFETDILLANPNNVAVPIQTTFLREDGSSITQSLTLPATTRVTIPVAFISGLESAAMSTFVSSTTQPIVVERTMRWDRTGYGAHTETASSEPALKWYFAEGSQGFFYTFLMLANLGATANSATVEFLFEDGTSVTKTYELLPTSRYTLSAGDVPELVNRSFGMTVTFAHPGLAERAMYFGTPIFNAGHDSAGATSPSTEWILAEGATGTFFTTFILLANPGTEAGDVTLTYLPQNAGAVPITRTYRLAAKQRLTINLAFEDPSLVNASVATRVTATVPIIAERAQYWPSTPDQWYEAHSSFGLTGAAKKWGLAEGRVGGPNGYQTFIMLANPTEHDTIATIQFLREESKSPRTVTKQFNLRANSRVTVSLPGADAPELADETFGAVITSFVDIVVERAVYSNANGQIWAAGTNAAATRLP
jgi:hypothetical protein